MEGRSWSPGAGAQGRESTGGKAPGEASLEELLEEARRGAEEAEAFFVAQRDEPVLFEANRLKEIQHRETSGRALRLIKDGRIGFSSTTDGGDHKGLVMRALEMAPFGAVAQFALPPRQPFPHVHVLDPKVEELSLEELVHLGQSLIDRVRASYPDVQWDARVTRGVSTLRLLNSRGGEAHYTKTGFGVSLEGTLVRGEDMLFVGDGQSSCRPIEDTTDIANTVLRQLEQAEATAPAPTGQVPVLFTPRGVAGALLGPLLMGFNGRNIVQGTSPLVGKLGEALLDPRLTILDDPLQDFSPGSRMCDDEGVPSRPVPLVEQGVIASFLYDLQTAGQAGTGSTGSAHRSLGSLPSPSASVLLLQPGTAFYEDMLLETQEGLLVEYLLGAGQGNLLGGDFSANVLLGYRIEQGRIVGRVKNAMLHGNVYTVLREIPAIGREAQWVGGSLRLPHLLCHGVSVSAKD